MNGNGPCQLQGELPESAFYIFYDLLAFLIQYILGICPFLFLQQEVLAAILGTHLNATCGYCGHFTNHAIIVAMLAGRIVLHKHHLSTFFQFKNLIRRI